MTVSRLTGGRHRRTPQKSIPSHAAPLENHDDHKKNRSLSQKMAKLLLAARAISLRTRSWVSTSLFILLLWFIAFKCCIEFDLSFDAPAHAPTSAFGKRPVMIQSLSPQHNVTKQLQLTDNPTLFIEDRENHYWINHGDYYHRSVTPQFENTTVCKPLQEWQTQSSQGLLTCNSFHTVNLYDSDAQLVGQGGFMNAWQIQEYDGKKLALKTMRFTDDLNFNHVNYHDYQKEALVYSELTASPYVANFYGFCSHSTMSEYSKEGILWWIFDSDWYPTKNKLLQIAHDLAAGLHDSHHVDAQGRATIAHMDIKANQFIKIDGIYKINDFNLCHLLSWNVTSNKYCGFENGYVGRWQAPEQYEEDYDHTSEKADIFSLGYVFYFLLTKKKPFKDVSGDTAHKLAFEGKRPVLKESILKSKHPFDVAVRTIMDRCFELDPAKRPSSREVRDYLYNALKEADLETTIEMQKRIIRIK